MILQTQPLRFSSIKQFLNYRNILKSKHKYEIIVNCSFENYYDLIIYDLTLEEYNLILDKLNYLYSKDGRQK